MKKWLLRIVIFLVVVSSGLYIYGSTLGVITSELEVVIHSDRTTVWNELQNPSGMDKWLEDFKELEMTSSGVPGTVGTSYKLIFETGNGEAVIHQTITEVVPAKRWTAVFNNEAFIGELIIELNDHPDGTMVHVKNELIGANALWKLLLEWNKDTMHATNKKSYTNLQAYIEQRHP